MAGDDDALHPSSKDNGLPIAAQSTATTRLATVSNHLRSSAPVTSKKRRRAPQSGLPADYSDIRDQMATIQKMAATPDPSRRGYVRQKQAGKLWVRERVDELFDRGSFREVGSLSGTTTWRQTGPISEEPVEHTPSNNVQGFGKLLGREVVFTADDYSIRAGHADGALMEKTIYMEKLSLTMQLPIIKLTDGSSGGGSVTTLRTSGYSYVPQMTMLGPVIKQLNAGIPNLGAVLGPAIGYGAARVVACHFSVMAADVGSLFNAGPQVVAAATFEEGLSLAELGGPLVHCANGTIDNMAANEAECFQQLRTVLSFLPNSGTQMPPVIPNADPVDRLSEDLRTIIPRRKERMFNVRKIITTVVDHGSFFEIGALWGTTAIVGLARLGGRPIGVIASNCEVNAGAIDTPGAQKMNRHLKFLEIFNIPLIQFVDVPGYAVGTAAERSAVMRHGVTLATTYFSTTIPIFSVLTRRVYGVAGAVMVDSRDPRFRVAWPSGEWGSLPLEGGIEVGHRNELKEVEAKSGAEARKKRYNELDEEYRRLMNPIRTANAFGIEEIIDPAATRPLLCEWTRRMYETILPLRVAERTAGRLVPSFA